MTGVTHIAAQHAPRYRSRPECDIGRLLDKYGIPFIYEKPMAVMV